MVESYAGMASKASTTRLAERTDRQGKGGVIATDIEFLDLNGNRLASAICGRDLLFRWHYRCAPGMVFRKCRVGLSVHDKTGEPFFLMSTELVDTTPLGLRGEGFIDFTLPELPLSGGVYHVMSFVESDRDIQDWVHNAALLPVVDGDFYGTGKAYPPGWQGKCVLVKYGWRVTETIAAGADRARG